MGVFVGMAATEGRRMERVAMRGMVDRMAAVVGIVSEVICPSWSSIPTPWCTGSCHR